MKLPPRIFGTPVEHLVLHCAPGETAKKLKQKIGENAEKLRKDLAKAAKSIWNEEDPGKYKKLAGTAIA